MAKCKNCYGTGKVHEDDGDDGFGNRRTKEVICKKCDGTGEVDNTDSEPESYSNTITHNHTSSGTGFWDIVGYLILASILIGWCS